MKRYQLHRRTNNMAMQTFDDDFNGIATTPKTTTPQAAATAPAQSAPAPKPAAAKAVAAATEEDETPTVNDNESLDTDFDDEKVLARPGQLDQCRPDKGKSARFAFIPKEL